MDSLLFLLAGILYTVLLVIMFIYGINFFYLAYITWRKNGPDPAPPPMPDLPKVSVQLPVFNELYVAERLINAAAHLDWPADKLDILVLDDSTDETREIVDKAVQQWQAQGVPIRRLHRTDRTGFKAGALAAGMEATDADFLAYFDADFLPPPDFLYKTIPHFADPKIAFVQTRWGHVNRDYSFLTFLESLAIDAHFIVEQFARSRGGYWFNFNGTAGVWRREAVVAAGGWKADTLTEDLDMSYRAFLAGWKAIYLRDIVTPAELPVTFTAFRRQQHRWAKGSLETAAKLMPQLWRSQASLAQKFEGTLHLTGYSIHLFMFILMLLYPAVIFFANRIPTLGLVYTFGMLFNIAALAPTLYFTVAQRHIGRNWWQKIPAILFMMALGAGMMMNTVRAAWQIIVRQGRTFERTPKFGIQKRDESWLSSRYQLRLDPLVFVEILVGAWNVLTIVLAVMYGNWLMAFYSSIYLVGILFVSGLTMAQMYALWSYRKKKAVAETVTA